MRRQRPDLYTSAALADVCEIGNASQIDEIRRCSEPQLHHWQQAMSARQDFGLILVSREQSESFLQSRRSHIFECAWNHVRLPPRGTIFLEYTPDFLWLQRHVDMSHSERR